MATVHLTKTRSCALPIAEALKARFAPLPSFHSRLKRELNLVERLTYNVEVELAKPDRHRVLNALNCELLYLIKRIDLYKTLLGQTRRPYHTYECHRASKKEIKDSQMAIEKAVEDVHDVAITLHSIVSRTLCQIMMACLPRELRDMIYGFLTPDDFYSLPIERKERLGTFAMSLSLRARELTAYCVNPSWGAIDSRRRCHQEHIPSTTFMGQGANEELMSKFFEFRAFRIQIIKGTEIPPINPWNYCVDPLKTIHNLEVSYLLTVFETYFEFIKDKNRSFAFLVSILRHCKTNFRWTVKILSPRNSFNRSTDTDLIFEFLTNCLSKIHIPPPKSITLMYNEDIWFLWQGNNRLYTLKAFYQGTLDAWLDIYHVTAENVGLYQSLGQRFEAYKLIQANRGRKIVDFRCEEGNSRFPILLGLP